MRCALIAREVHEPGLNVHRSLGHGTRAVERGGAVVLSVGGVDHGRGAHALERGAHRCAIAHVERKAAGATGEIGAYGVGAAA